MYIYLHLHYILCFFTEFNKNGTNIEKTPNFG